MIGNMVHKKLSFGFWWDTFCRWFSYFNGNNLSFMKNKLKIFLSVLTVCFLLILEAQLLS